MSDKREIAGKGQKHTPQLSGTGFECFGITITPARLYHGEKRSQGIFKATEQLSKCTETGSLFKSLATQKTKIADSMTGANIVHGRIGV